MLEGQVSQARSRDLHPRFTLNRAALRHLALLLLLTPLTGGLRMLIDHVDQRSLQEPIVVREVVEVPRTEYVQIEVPVPTVIVVEVPAQATPVSAQASPSDIPATLPASVAVAAPARASVAPQGMDAASLADVEAPTDPRSDPSRAVASVPARSDRPGPGLQAFEPQSVDKQSTSEPLAETPGQDDVVAETPGRMDVIAESSAPAAPLSPAQHALADFYAYTDQNWSVQGYSSVDEMRDWLGNSTTGWLNETRRQASAPIDSPGAVAGSEVAIEGDNESTSEPEPMVLAQPTLSSTSSEDSFHAYIEQNWSALGYSSAEEMRRSLGVD